MCYKKCIILLYCILGISCGKPTLDDGVIVAGNAYLYQEKLKILCPPGLYKFYNNIFLI